MRRSLITIVGILALSLPVTLAFGAAKTYEGTVEDGGTMQFKLNNGKVKKFKWSGVPINCDQGPSTYGGVITNALDVDNGKFGIRADNDGGGIVKLEGDAEKT